MSRRRLRVGLYVNDEKANLLRLVRCLRQWNMDFVSIWRDTLKDLKPGDVDVLLLHGGWYGLDRDAGQNQYGPQASGPHHEAMAAAVRGFVKAGGGVVGVCCGGFNVVWLGLIEADISRAQGAGLHTLETVQAAHPILHQVIERAAGRTDRDWKPLPVVRVNGPIFFPKQPDQMLMSYDWEHRLGAILAAPFGKGRAVAISPHPELLEHETGGGPVPDGELMRVSLLLRNALYWSAGEPLPPDPPTL
jgi:hypothetical protein